MSGAWFVKVYDNFHYQDEDETCMRRPLSSARLARQRDFREAAQRRR